MDGARTSAGPVDLGFTGAWIELLEPSEDNMTVLQGFHDERRLTPVMGSRGPAATAFFAPPMLIRERRGGETVGAVESYGGAGAVAEYAIYLDPVKGRPGYGLEATALYVSHLFDAGARLVSFEVMSFNREVIGIMRKSGWPVRVRLREQAYVGGRFWDLLVYSFNREEWLRGIERHRRRLPGGDLKPTAVGRLHRITRDQPSS